MQKSSQPNSPSLQPAPPRRAFKRAVSVLVLVLLVGGAVMLVRRMQQTFLEEVAVELPAQTLQASGVRPAQEAIGKAALDFELAAFNMSSTSVRLYSLRGKPVVLLFFASWSDASVEGLKSLDVLRPELVKQDIVVFAAHTLEPKEAAGRLLERLGLASPILLDEDGAVAEAYGVSTLPSLFFIGRDGILKSELSGAMEHEDVRAKALALVGL